MKRNIYVSVVSHNNEKDIVENFSHFPFDMQEFNLVISIVDNVGSDSLKNFCKEKNFNYTCDGVTRGYGENHNLNFKSLNPKDEDLFLVLNPDIYISEEDFKGMVKSMQEKKVDLLNIKSYLDKEKEIIDYPDRYYPGILNFFISLATGKRLHYGENPDVKNPEWMSGGFMLFKASSYRKLGGFDEDYFMYCEDIDICFRAKKMGMTLEYDNRYYNLHNSSMHSRKLLSKNMFWHLNSAFKFVLKNRFYKPVTFAQKDLKSCA